MKTVVFDIVLGLILIYLIHSIFISIIGEMIATWTGLRARVLRQGITNLLTDLQEKEEGNFLQKIWQYFLLEPKGFDNTKAAEFYEQPAIKYLSQGQNKTRSKKRSFLNVIFQFRKDKPSYISKDLFSATLINMFREKGRGIHDWAKVGFSIDNNTNHFDKDTAKQIKSMYDDADDDMEVFIKKLENWFQEMMDRANGWYKRKLQLMIFWLSFFIAMILNVDTFEIASTLSRDDTLRTQFVQLAVAAADNNSNIAQLTGKLDSQFVEEELYDMFQELSQEIENTNILLGNGWDYPQQKIKHSFKSSDEKLIAGIQANSENAVKAKDSLDILTKHLSIRGLNYLQTDTILTYYRAQKDSLDIALANIKFLTGKTFLFLDAPLSTNNNKYLLTGITNPKWYQKYWHIIKNSLPHKKKCWGFCITALAVCLGAPFWFDLLKKLVSIRSAGVNPLEKEEQKPTEEIRQPDVKSSLGKTIKGLNNIDLAIEKNRSNWEAIPGVIAINKILESDSNNTKKYVIEILHQEEFDTSSIPGSVELNENLTIKIKKQAGTIATYQLSEKKRDIVKTMQGTIAGLLENKDTDKPCVLTCAHVLSTAGQSIVFNGEDKIKGIGTINKMIWSNVLDAGVIDLAKDTKVEDFDVIPEVYNASVQDSIDGTQVYIQAKDGKNRGKDEDGENEEKFKDKIKIIHVDFDFNFKDDTGQSYKLYNLITIAKQENDVNTMPTQAGDSGALVKTLNGDKALGIVIGGFKNKEGLGLSFILPMQKIIDTLNLKIHEPLKQKQNDEIN